MTPILSRSQCFNRFYIEYIHIYCSWILTHRIQTVRRHCRPLYTAEEFFLRQSNSRKAKPQTTSQLICISSITLAHSLTYKLWIIGIDTGLCIYSNLPILSQLLNYWNNKMMKCECTLASITQSDPLFREPILAPRSSFSAVEWDILALGPVGANIQLGAEGPKIIHSSEYCFSFGDGYLGTLSRPVLVIKHRMQSKKHRKCLDWWVENYSISQEIFTRFLLCCALLCLYIDWFSHIHQAYFTGTVAI